MTFKKNINQKDQKEMKDNNKSLKKEKNELITKEPMVYGKNLSISRKQGVAICKFISKKKIGEAIKDLELVIKLKKPIPMRGEIPHRRGKGIMSARYPVKASKIVIKLLKSLKTNAFAKNIEFESYKIAAKTNLAPRPYKRFGQKKMKKAHIIIKLIKLNKLKKDIKDNEKNKKN